MKQSGSDDEQGHPENSINGSLYHFRTIISLTIVVNIRKYVKKIILKNWKTTPFFAKMGTRLVYALVGSEGAGPLLNMSIEGNFQVTMWRHRCRHHHQNTFWGRSSHIWCQIEAVFNISKFSNWQSFWGHNKLFFTGSDTWSDTGSWICQDYSHGHLRCFNFWSTL